MDAPITNPTPQKGGSGLRIALIGLFAVIAAVGGYLIIDYVRKNRKNANEEKEKAARAAAAALLALGIKSTNSEEGDTTTVAGTTYTNTGSAITYGSYGDNVKLLQQGLIDVYGYANVLKVYHADGAWGDETQAALNKYGWATSYADLAAITAQIKAKKPTSTVAGEIDIADTQYYLVKANKYTMIYKTSAGAGTTTIGDFNSGTLIGIVSLTALDAAKDTNYIKTAFYSYPSYKIGYVKRGNLDIEYDGTISQIIAYIKTLGYTSFAATFNANKAKLNAIFQRFHNFSIF